MNRSVIEKGDGLLRRIEELAGTDQLLIACDYDGTLSPIVPNPTDARPVRESVVALQSLAEIPRTHVAVVSGRALADLARLTGLPPEVHLVGSHGSEFDVGFTQSLSTEQHERLRQITAAVKEIAGALPGASIETKPASVAFHYRNADQSAATDAIRRVEALLENGGGVYAKRGKMVLELTVVETNKGTAIDTLRRRLGAKAVLFIGDDVTDEDAFRILKGPDVGVKVGAGDTAAAWRIDDTEDVARILGRLAEQRAAWICGGEAVPIETHSILSDQRTVAVVTPDARVTFFPVPQIDAPPLFAELIGGPTAGVFAVHPEDGAKPIAQAYVGDSLVLKTEFPTFSVTDFLDCSGGQPRQRAGRTDLVRIIQGHGRVAIEFAPRLDFGRMPTEITARDDGLEMHEHQIPIVLRSAGVDWEITREGRHHVARAVVELGEEPIALVLRCGSGSLRPASRTPEERRDSTARWWSRDVERLSMPERYADEIRRSALMLRSLVHGPTGAIAAAATTSLPEDIGGVRNWDYRYCWPRDAAIAAHSLARLGSLTEGLGLLDWLLGVVEGATGADHLRPLYSVRGDEITVEGEVGELSGYAGSRPVRIGNAAAHQIQLDVFGPVVDLVHALACVDAPLTPQHWSLVEAMVHAVERRWREPDHGIWEVRASRRHHVHSKTMCWCTVDRAIKASDLLWSRTPPHWRELRDEIAADVIEHGWSKDRGCYTSAYDSDEIDAANLLIGLTGLLKPDDERFIKTVEAVETDLRRGPAVYRYRYDDGLPGFEGAFNLCTCWLIQSYLLIGRRDEAQSLFEHYLDLIGPTGVMSEEYGVNTGRALGNIPQAYSHAGLIDCALALQSE